MMKRRIIGLMVTLFGLAVLAQVTSAKPVLKNMLNSRLAEIELKSPMDAQLIQDAGGIFDHYSGPVPHVYLLPEDFEALRARGFSVRWLPEERIEPGRLDTYHENADIQTMFTNWQTAHPDLFSYQSIGNSVQGRPLLMAKISDNVVSDEAEIEVKYISSMHGDEIVGLENCLKFIDTLLTGYGSNAELTGLVEDFEIYIMPLMNPDGRDVGTLGQRWNANGIDLNRDFPDRCWDSVNTVAGRQTETGLVMNFTATRNFVLSANFHGGAIVANYPWDSNYSGTDTYSPSPEQTLFFNMALTYSTQNHTMFTNSAFPPDGTTNGAEWYHVSGGMQDWNYVWMGNKEITVELSTIKSGPESALDSLWRENRQAMIDYLELAREGVRGFVTDAETGNPVRANIMLANIPYLTYSTALHGDYFRMLRPGTYSLTFSAPGYVSQTVTGINVVAGTPTILNIQLSPAPRAEIAVLPTSFSEPVDLCSTRDVSIDIQNHGDAALSWSSSELTFTSTDYGAGTGSVRWIDSRVTGGPTYNWVEIGTIGTQIAFSTDDQNAGPYPIGFAFPFYGNNYTQVRVAANGWISFTSTATGATSYTNLSLPNASAPENILAIWWDDLSPQRAGTNVRRWTNNVDSFVVSYQNVQSFANSGLYNFEVILKSDGSITYQYANMGTNRLESAAIGMQNSDRTRGATVINNGPYIGNSLAIKFCPAPAVQTIPASGNVAIGGTQTVTLRLSSCCLPDGPSLATLRFASNDPITPVLDVPVTIDAGGAIAPDAVADLTIYSDGSNILLDWSAASNATSYSVWRSSVWPPDFGNSVQIGATTNTDFLTVSGTGPEFYFVVSER